MKRATKRGILWSIALIVVGLFGVLLSLAIVVPPQAVVTRVGWMLILALSLLAIAQGITLIVRRLQRRG